MALSFTIYFLILYSLTGLGVSFYYHRILTHRTHYVNPIFERFLLLLALPAGTPIQWVGTHLKHHKYTDVAGDPHSPNIDGFLVAHCGWYINQKRPFLILLYAFSGAFRMLFDAFWRPRNGLENNHYAKKIIGNKLCETVSKPINYTLIVFIYFTFLAIISVFIFGYYNGILFYYLTMVIIYNLGDAINSFGHNTFFIKPKNKENKSINSLFLSLFTFGEGFHEVHHSKPSKFRMNKNRFTISSLFIYLLELTHLIKPSRI